MATEKAVSLTQLIRYNGKIQEQLQNATGPTQEQINESIQSAINNGKISNYDDTDVKNKISTLKEDFDSITETKTTKTPLELNFNEAGWYHRDGSLLEATGTGYYHSTHTVNAGEVYEVDGWTGGDVRTCMLFDGSNNVVGMYPPADEYSNPCWTEVKTTVTIPNNAVKMIFSTNIQVINNWTVNKVSTISGIKGQADIQNNINTLTESETILKSDNKVLKSLMIDAQERNDFAWKSFEGTKYATFTFDDSNADISTIEDLFERKGVPCCFATIPSRLDAICDSGETVKQVLDRAIENGGEVLAHDGSPLTKTSTDLDYTRTYVTNHQQLVDAGFDVNGIIVAGGTDAQGNDYQTQDWQKGIKMCRAIYKYSDLVSYHYDTNIEQYSNRRCFIDPGYDSIKSYIDGYISGDQSIYSNWINFASHGTNTNTIDVFEQIIDYCIAQGITITTWSNIYDMFKSNKAANTTLYDDTTIKNDIKSAQNDIKSLQSNIQDGTFNMSNIVNGKVKVLEDVNGIDQSSQNILVDTSNNIVQVVLYDQGNEWSKSVNPIVPDFSQTVHVSFDAKLDSTHTSSQNNLTIWLTSGTRTYTDSNNCSVFKTITVTADYVHYDIEFDPSYYAVYKDPAWTQFNIWLVAGGESGKTTCIDIYNYQVYQHASKTNTSIIKGQTAKEMFESVDTSLADILSTSSETVLISPSGKKYKLNIADDGTFNSCPIVPTKSVFFGNSLLSGNGFGMCASDEEHDYYYLINAAIKNMNSSYTAKKYGADEVTGWFENNSTESAIDSAIQQITNNLEGDETLVVIQLGDNVNTAEKVAIFGKSSAMLCKQIRQKCPNANVVWMGTWYNANEVYSHISNACVKTGCKPISFSGLVTDDARGKIGNVQKLTSSAARTLPNVSNVTENTTSEDNKNITVTFTVDGTAYTSTLDVTDYTLTDTTLTYTSIYNIVYLGGIASHPGNEGFRRIANRFLYEVGLTDKEEYYTKDMLGIN